MTPTATWLPQTGKLRLCGTNNTISTLDELVLVADTGGMKRTVQVNVKMTQEGFRATSQGCGETLAGRGYN
jgi:hypothetical protein